VDETGSGICQMVGFYVVGARLSGSAIRYSNWLVGELLCNNKQAFVTGTKFHLFVGLLPEWLFIRFPVAVVRKHLNKWFRN
jgi:hypothetical protein